MVRIACEHARSPLILAELAAKIGAELPDLPSAAIDALLAQLIGCGVLITGLRPPSTCRDGLAHLLDQLAAANADTIADLQQLCADLTGIAVLPADGRACGCGSWPMSSIR